MSPAHAKAYTQWIGRSQSPGAHRTHPPLSLHTHIHTEVQIYPRCRQVNASTCIVCNSRSLISVPSVDVFRKIAIKNCRQPCRLRLLQPRQLTNSKCRMSLDSGCEYYVRARFYLLLLVRSKVLLLIRSESISKSAVAVWRDSRTLRQMMHLLWVGNVELASSRSATAWIVGATLHASYLA